MSSANRALVRRKSPRPPDVSYSSAHRWLPESNRLGQMGLADVPFTIQIRNRPHPRDPRVQHECRHRRRGLAVRCSGLPGVRSGRPRLRSSLGPAPARIGVGGSIPFVKQFGDRFGDRAPLILNGVLDPASAPHAPNESLYLGATSHDPPSPTSGSRPTLGDKSSIGSSSRFATAPPTSSSTHSTSSPAWRLWFRVRD